MRFLRDIVPRGRITRAAVPRARSRWLPDDDEDEDDGDEDEDDGDGDDDEGDARARNLLFGSGEFSRLK